MRTLYELTSDYMELLDLMDNPEIDEQAIIDTMEGLQGEIEDKADGYAKVMKQMDAEAEGLEKEIERLTARKRTIQRNKDLMKTRLRDAMIATGKLKIKTELFGFSVVNNGGKLPVIYATDPEQLPEAYKIEVKTYKANDEAVRKALDAGKESPFFRYGERGKSLRIR